MKNIKFRNSILLGILMLAAVMVCLGQTKPDLIPSDEKFTKDGGIQIKMSLGKPYKVESGILNGVNYQFWYSDGSGTFLGKKDGIMFAGDYSDNWQVGCKKDAIDDTKICFMRIKTLMVFISGKDKYSVSIGNNNYPRTPAAIRVDGGEPIKGGVQGIFIDEESDKIIAELKKGKQVVTRYQKFPKEYNTDDTFELYGFNEAFEYINWAFSKIK